jgi:hypothetical protein
MSGLAGAVVWAVVPVTPQTPFRLYAGTDHKPIEVADAATIIKGVRKGGDAQFEYIVPGKVRPVLILSDTHDDDLGEYLALRLARFSKLTTDEQKRVRARKHSTLFHLEPERFSLPEENAAMLAGLVRIHRTAIEPSTCGHLDEHELRTVHERFVLFHGFDVRALLQVAIQQAKRKP